MDQYVSELIGNYCPLYNLQTFFRSRTSFGAASDPDPAAVQSDEFDQSSVVVVGVAMIENGMSRQ
jgi:hypothetical protein